MRRCRPCVQRVHRDCEGGECICSVCHPQRHAQRTAEVERAAAAPKTVKPRVSPPRRATPVVIERAREADVIPLPQRGNWYCDRCGSYFVPFGDWLLHRTGRLGPCLELHASSSCAPSLHSSPS